MNRIGRTSRLDGQDLPNFLMFVGPALIAIIVFVGLPTMLSFAYAFTRWDGISASAEYLGLDNFRRIFSSMEQDFWRSSIFTLKFTGLNIVLVNAVALGLALIVTSRVPTRSLYRAAFFFPNVLSWVVISFIWLFMFRTGSDALYDLLGLGIFQTSWLSNPSVVLFSLILVSIWQGSGFFMVIYIAGLQSIPAELFEAATIDGAGPISKFRRITLPMLIPAFSTTFFFSIIGSLKLFDLVFAMTRGGPGRETVSIALDIYRTGLDEYRFGLASAKGLLLFIFIIIVTVLQQRAARKGQVDL